MTIAYLNHVGIIGGAERSLLELMEAATGIGYRPLLLAPPGPLHDEARAAGAITVAVPFEDVSKTRLLRDPLSIMGRLRGLGRIVGQAVTNHGVVLIHANSLKSAIVASFVPAVPGVPMIWHVRDRVPVAEPLRRVLIMMASRRAKLVVANSAYTKRQIGLASERCRVLPNGIPLERYRITLPTPQKGDLTIGVVGRIAPEKGHDLFVQMAVMLHRRHPAMRFIVCGDIFPGAQRFARQVRRQVETAGLTDAFVWRSYQPDPALIFAGIDIVVVPSRSEGFGRVMLEAMAVGIPVVATNVGGMSELGTHGRDALYFEPSAAAGAEQIDRLAGDRNLRNSLTAEGHRTAHRYTADRMALGLRAIYDEALRG